MASQMSKSFGISRKGHTVLPALGYPQFRLLWVSGLSTWVGRWIEALVGAWLVLELTNSPFWVGLLGSCRFAPFLLGPYCGTICDRINQRFVLLTVQVVYFTASLALLVLFALGRIEVWHLFVFTFIGGLCFTFDLSARYSLAASIVKDDHIVSSISLMQVANGTTSVVGPLMGGALFEVFGATGCFALIATSFFLSFVALLAFKFDTKAPLSNRGSIGRDLVSGLRYIMGDRLLFSLILMAGMVNLFIFPYAYTLMPIFARDILGTGSSGFGQLMAGAGLGAILGSLAMGATPQSANRGKYLVIAIMAWPVILMTLSFSKSFQLSIALLVIAGVAQGISMSLIHALLLMRASGEMRGRVAGARAFAISTLTLGNFLTGYEASLWDAPTALIINTSVFILITTLMVVWASELVRRE